MANINYILFGLLELENQTKILHWQTDSYAHHIAYGNFHSALSILLDKFIETYMGKKFGSRFILEKNELALKNINEIDIHKFLQLNLENLEKLSILLNNNTDTDLLNLKDEMIANINKLRYHLSLT